MTTLDDAERRLDYALGRLENVTGRLSAWRDAEASAQRRAAEAEASAQRRAAEAEASAQARIEAAEADAGQRAAQAESVRAVAVAERDTAIGEHQALRERCAELDRELEKSRAALERQTVETSRRIAELDSQLGIKTDEHRQMAEHLREMEAAATEEVGRLDALCDDLRRQLLTAQAAADRLGRATRGALDSLQQALRPQDGDG